MARRLRCRFLSLDDAEVWGVSAAALAGSFVPRLAPAMLALIGLYWLARLLGRMRSGLAEDRPTSRTPADWPIALLLLTMLAGIAVALSAGAAPATSLEQGCSLGLGIGLYYTLATRATSLRQLGQIRLGLLILCVVLALMTPLVSARPLPGLAPWSSFAATHLSSLRSADLPWGQLIGGINANVLAGAVALVLPLALGWLLYSWNRLAWPNRVALLGSILLALAAIGVTRSRGALMGIGTAFLLLLALRWRIGRLLAALAVLGLCVFVAHEGSQPIVGAIGMTGTLGGWEMRFDVWARAINLLQDFPFTGVGLHAFSQVVNLLYPSLVIGPGATIDHAHNLFLQIALDLGLFGLVGWLAVYFLVSVGAWRIYREGRLSGDSCLSGLGAGLLAAQLALVVHGLLDAVTWGTRPAILVWALWGLAIAAWQGGVSRRRSAALLGG